jgi:hypothetical protein
MKSLLFTLFFFLASVPAHAEDTPASVIAGLRPTCLKVIDENIVRDMGGNSSVPMSGKKVCDCASARFIGDPLLARIAGLKLEERRALPTIRKISLYLASKYASASYACYAEAIAVSADHIDTGR